MSFIDINTLKPSNIKNRFQIARSYNSGLVTNTASPVELILEITNNCNLECIMCPRVNMKRPVGSMDIELFKSIIDQIKNHIELVYLSGGLGEPTMHRKLKEMIEYAKKQNVRIGISTNATLLSEKIANDILEAKPDILLLSLDGATKETHEKIRVGSKFEKTMANVEKFLELKANKKANLPYTVVQMVYMPENQSEADAFKNKWKKFKSVNDIRMKKFLHLQGANYFPDSNGEIKMTPKEPSCVLPWRQLSISWDGKLSICCRDLEFTTIIGELKANTISELWNSEKMKEFRKKLSSGKKNEIPICKGCAGVQTNAFTQTGSILFDDLTIRKLLPIAEKIALKTGLKITDYE